MAYDNYVENVIKNKTQNIYLKNKIKENDGCIIYKIMVIFTIPISINRKLTIKIPFFLFFFVKLFVLVIEARLV